MATLPELDYPSPATFARSDRWPSDEGPSLSRGGRTATWATGRAVYVPAAELSGVEPTEWLSSAEQARYEGLRAGPARAAFLLGRLAVKRLVFSELPSLQDPQRLAVVSRDASGRSVRPWLELDGSRQPWAVSISHTVAGALVAWDVKAGVSVGADLVSVVRLGEGFRRIWFTPSEQRWTAGVQSLTTCSVWAVKEAVYKAFHDGEGFAPRTVEVTAPTRCRYRGREVAAEGWLRTWQIDGQVAALARRRSASAAER